jgi:hypothetical protein
VLKKFVVCNLWFVVAPQVREGGINAKDAMMRKGTQRKKEKEKEGLDDPLSTVNYQLSTIFIRRRLF